jgi:imidazolonepropionase-like amidohydrolase
LSTHRKIINVCNPLNWHDRFNLEESAMRQISALILSLILPVLLLAQPKQSVQSKQIALAHVTVIDATGAPARKDMTVIITNDRITQIGEARKTRVPSGAQIIDATGKFLIPGLWDMHVHFWNDEKLLSLYAANGVTGVRDMGGDLERVKRWKKEIALGAITGPRIVAPGDPLDKAPVRAMQMARVAIMAGTDTGDPYTYPGFTLHEELGLLVEAGLTPMQALQAATLAPAKYLGMLDSIGTVEKGKIADLVLLDANPLDSISNTQKIAAVIIGGKLIAKTALEKMLAEAEADGSKAAR